MRRLPGKLPRDMVVVLATAAVLLAGCSRADSAQPSAGPSARPTAASPTPTPTSTRDPDPAAPRTDTSAAPPVTTGPASPSTGPGPTAPSGDSALPPEAPLLPPGQSAAANGFAQCASRYQERIDGVTLGGPITPVLLERWAQAYQAAAALSAEGDSAGAASACNALQTEMDEVLG